MGSDWQKEWRLLGTYETGPGPSDKLMNAEPTMACYITILTESIIATYENEINQSIIQEWLA
jgi:hypothetical protein